MAGVLHTASAERAPGLFRLCVPGADWLRYAWDMEINIYSVFHTGACFVMLRRGVMSSFTLLHF